MKTHHPLKATMASLAFLICAGAHAATLTKAEYTQSKEQIEGNYKSEKAACNSMAGNAKDICMEEAKGHHKVGMAELEYKNSGAQSDLKKVAETKAEATYAVAKEHCDDKAGNEKDVCVKEAKAVRDKAMADLKLSQAVGDARKDASQEKRDADYKVATEKCDALAGDAKAQCVQQAKVQFGKS